MKKFEILKYVTLQTIWMLVITLTCVQTQGNFKYISHHVVSDAQTNVEIRQKIDTRSANGSSFNLVEVPEIPENTIASSDVSDINKSFTCDYCSQIFGFKKVLIKHMAAKYAPKLGKVNNKSSSKFRATGARQSLDRAEKNYINSTLCFDCQ